MATTTVSDFVIWVKQVYDDERIAERILDLAAGETVNLVVDGVQGVWRKMEDGKDGRPTRGVKPLGRTQDVWRSLYRSRRGEIVTLELAKEQGPPPRTLTPLSPPLGHTVDERQAALEALLDLGRQGWRSEDVYGSRDELYDRS